MHTERQRYQGGHLILGAVITLVGLVFLFDNLGWICAGDVLRWWPGLLVAAGVYHLTRSQRGGNSSFWGAFLVIVGVILLINAAGWVHVHLWAWWPLLLVAFGASILRRGIQHRRAMENPTATGGDDSVINGSAFLGGWKRSIHSKAFRGGELTAFMGGIELDLRDAVIEGREARLSISSMMGGVEIHIPVSWRVDVRVSAFLGGVEDKTHPSPDPDAPILILNGSVFMGGVEIGN